MILNSQSVGMVNFVDAFMACYDIAGLHIVYLYFSKLLDDNEWLDSRSVDCELFKCIYNTILYCRLFIYYLKPTTVGDQY